MAWAARSGSKLPNLSSKTKRRIHGIDFKNPFTMSNKESACALSVSPTPRGVRQTDVFIFWKILEATYALTAAPSVAAKLRLVARFAALTGLGEIRCKLRLLRLFACGLVEPIGIEPMT